VRVLFAALPWRPVATASGVAVCLLSIVAVWPESGFAAVGIKLALVCLAAAACFVLDEPAAAAVDSLPRTLRARTVTRLLGAAVPAMIGIAGFVVVGARLSASAESGSAFADLPIGGLLLQLAGCLLLGIAAAALARRFVAEPGDLVSGVVAGGLTTLVIYNPFARWVDIFALSSGDRWSRSVVLWTAVCLVSVAALGRATRDPLD